jgi:hypothetical protein
MDVGWVERTETIKAAPRGNAHDGSLCSTHPAAHLDWNNCSGEGRRGRKTVCDTRNAQDAACLFDRSGSCLFTSVEARRYVEKEQDQDMERQRAKCSITFRSSQRSASPFLLIFVHPASQASRTTARQAAAGGMIVTANVAAVIMRSRLAATK